MDDFWSNQANNSSRSRARPCNHDILTLWTSNKGTVQKSISHTAGLNGFRKRLMWKAVNTTLDRNGLHSVVYIILLATVEHLCHTCGAENWVGSPLWPKELTDSQNSEFSNDADKDTIFNGIPHTWLISLLIKTVLAMIPSQLTASLKITWTLVATRQISKQNSAKKLAKNWSGVLQKITKKRWIYFWNSYGCMMVFGGRNKNTA